MTPRTRRLHPAMVGAEALSGLRGFVVPLLLIGFVGSRDLSSTLLYGLAGVALSVVAAFVAWQTTQWTLDADGVRLRRSFIGESLTEVPYDRVQAIDTVRGPVQRLFGVVELHVQTAGGGAKGEIVLRAVTPEEAEQLREAVRRGGGDATTDAAPDPLTLAPERPVTGTDPVTPPANGALGADETGSVPVARPAVEWSLGVRHLLVAAATSGSLAVLLPVVAFGSQVIDDLLGFEDAERLLPDTLGEAALVLAAVLVAAWVLSFLGTIVAFAGFSVTRDAERLRIRRGILERREASVPVARVHAVRIVESPLRQPLGFAQVRIESAGYAKEAASAQTLVPLVRRRDVRAVLAQLLPEHDAPLEVEPLPRRALRRYVVPYAVLAALLTAGAVVAFGAVGLAAAILVAVAVVAGLAAYRTAGVALHGDHVVLRTRSATLARTTSAADARRLQAVRTFASPFQRRARLATLAVDVSSGRSLRVGHLDADRAGALLGTLAAAATAPPPARRAP